jgi:histidyl-tRNA synthetase
MATAKTPSIPKGTRDFGPVETSRRNYIFSVIKDVFSLHGYVEIETPAMENLDTLLGKYGEEGDKLLFRILNSGDFLSSLNENDLKASNSSTFSSKITEKGLRYDLTVPFARYVVQHRNEISFPFKRFQIQPVWRADRPQKGRYREFYQCDADVIGSDSLLNELELINIISEVFRRLKINITIKINNRKILAGISEFIGYPDKMTDITTAIDKYEKTGADNVKNELLSKGINEEAIAKLEKLIFTAENSNEKKLEHLGDVLSGSTVAMKGISEITALFEYCRLTLPAIHPVFDMTLARGLNYYTGAIIEVKADDFEIGSICGGGRYDDLTGIFGLPGLSGVGISFGAERIYDVMLQGNLFPGEAAASSKILFTNFGEKEALYCLGLINELHAFGISAELYPDQAKMKKQLAYADGRKIRYVAMVGEDEISQNIITLKDLSSGNQEKIDIKALAELLAG